MASTITRIFFVRHGDVLNHKGIIYGYLNYPLSPDGKTKIRKVAVFLKKRGISYIYASPIRRCRETAGIIGRTLGLKPKIERRLIEAEWTKAWQGTPAALMTKIFPSQWETYRKNPARLRAGGSTLPRVAARVASFTKDMVSRHAGQTVVAITHGDPLKCLILKLQGKGYNNLHKIRCRYGAIVEVVYEGSRFKKIKFHSHGSKDLVYLK